MPTRSSIFPADLSEVFGQIDIYLFDQLLRGRISRRDRVFDAGCGSGRNLAFLLRAGYDVAGVDSDAEAVDRLRAMASALRPDLSPEAFRVEPIEAASARDGWADVVLSSAVMHFARDAAHFEAMLRGCWRVLRPGGVFFCRLASSIGIEGRIRPEPAAVVPASGVTTGRFVLPDGTTRFLVDEGVLMSWTTTLQGDLIDPLKTTIVQDQRAMTTWVVRKRDGR